MSLNGYAGITIA